MKIVTGNKCYFERICKINNIEMSAVLLEKRVPLPFESKHNFYKTSNTLLVSLACVATSQKYLTIKRLSDLAPTDACVLSCHFSKPSDHKPKKPGFRLCPNSKSTLTQSPRRSPVFQTTFFG